MSKPVKDLITAEYREAFGDLNSACVVSVIGLDAIATNKLRGELRARKLKLQVVKNSLARRAFADTALAPLGGVMQGPCALVTGEGTSIETAKVLVELKKTYPQIELKHGLLDGEGEVLDLERLSKMKSRLEVLADLAGLLRSPAARLAGALRGPGGRLAGCFKAMADKAGDGEAASDAVAEAASN